MSEDRTTLTFTGTLDGPDLTKCAVASATLDITAATCTLGEQLNPDEYVVVGATLTSSSVVDGVYTVVFTADSGSLFAAGDGVSEDRTTLTLTGTLAGVDLTLCPVATASLAFIDPTCDDDQMLDEDSFDMVNATLVSADVVDGEYTVVFEAEGDALFAVGDGVSPDRTTLTLTGTLDPNDERLCLAVEASFTLPPATCEVGEDWENPIIVADAGVISGEPQYDSEAQTVSIMFTATAAYIFVIEVEGEPTFSKTLTLTLDVAERDPSLCGEPTYEIPVMDATCELGEILDVEGISAENATFVVVDDGSESGTYEIEFTADDDYRFADDQKKLTVTGELADRDPSLCEEPSFDIPVTDATCELGEILDVEGISAENASFAVVDDGSESGTYEIEFTADDDYRFAGDLREITVTGELAGPDTELCLEAIAAIAVTDADCFFDSVLDEEGFTAENAEFEVTVYNVETREYEVVFTADYGYRFDTSLAGVSEDGRTQTFSGTLDAADPNGDGCVLPITDASITFVDATCLAPESLDEDGFEFDSELASLQSVTYDGLDYEVVFVTIGDDTVFFQSSEPVEGRTVSEDGKVLTFTGTLDGPNAELCPDLPTAPVTTASVTWVLPDCLGNPGSFTLRSEPGVIWTVDGVVVEGNKTYTAAIGSTPSIEASLEPASEEFPTGFGWNDENQRTVWNLSFPAADDCLPTLAITGASNALSGLGMVAVLIMMAGTGLVVARRREAARIQG